MQGSSFFSLMVVGDNPRELLDKYDSSKYKESYVKYRFKDAGKIKKETIKQMEKLLQYKKEAELSDVMVEYLEERIKSLKTLSDFEFYASLTDGMDCDEEGNALANENPNAKWKICQDGKNLCVPLRLKDGRDVFSAKMKDINWEYLMGGTRATYELAWKLFHDEVKPQNDEEKQIQVNMSTQGKYFSQFEDMEQYVTYCSSYFAYAYLDENGWQDMENKDRFAWVKNFYNKFIKNIDPEATISIFECTKP